MTSMSCVWRMVSVPPADSWWPNAGGMPGIGPALRRTLATSNAAGAWAGKGMAANAMSNIRWKRIPELPSPGDDAPNAVNG